MLVSIIIPTYNRCQYIGLTLESFINQHFDKSKFEIIIADNNSNDNTKDVVSQFIETNNGFNISYFVEGRQGVHFARNSAAKRAKAEYLYFTDDDMIADTEMLTELIYLFSLDKKVASVTGLVLPKWEVFPPDWILKLCNNALLSLNNPEYDLIVSDNDCNVFSCHQMIRRDIFFQSGGFNPENTKGEWIGDGETGLNIKIKEMGYKFAFNRKSVVHHIIPASRLTQNYLNQRLANQGNCDSYTYYRKLRPSAFSLFFTNIGLFLKSAIHLLKHCIKKVEGDITWRLSIANSHYYIARIKFNWKLMNNAEWRKLVLKSNWIDE